MWDEFTNVEPENQWSDEPGDALEHANSASLRLAELADAVRDANAVRDTNAGIDKLPRKSEIIDYADLSKVVPPAAVDCIPNCELELLKVATGKPLSREQIKTFEDAIVAARTIDPAKARDMEKKLIEQVQTKRLRLPSGKELPCWTPEKEQEVLKKMQATEKALSEIPELLRSKVASLASQPDAPLGTSRLELAELVKTDKTGKVMSFMLAFRNYETFIKENQDGLARRELHRRDLALLHSEAVCRGIYAIALDRSGAHHTNAKMIENLHHSLRDNFTANSIPELLALKQKYDIFETDSRELTVPGSSALRRAEQIMADVDGGDLRTRLEQARPLFEQAIGASDRIDIPSVDRQLAAWREEFKRLKENPNAEREQQLLDKFYELFGLRQQPGLTRFAYALTLHNVGVETRDADLRDEALALLKSIIKIDPSLEFDPCVQGALKLAQANPAVRIDRMEAQNIGEPEVKKLIERKKEEAPSNAGVSWRAALTELGIGVGSLIVFAALVKGVKRGVGYLWRSEARDPKGGNVFETNNRPAELASAPRFQTGEVLKEARSGKPVVALYFDDNSKQRLVELNQQPSYKDISEFELQDLRLTPIRVNGKDFNSMARDKEGNVYSTVVDEYGRVVSARLREHQKFVNEKDLLKVGIEDVVAYRNLIIRNDYLRTRLNKTGGMSEGIALYDALAGTDNPPGWNSFEIKKNGVSVPMPLVDDVLIIGRNAKHASLVVTGDGVSANHCQIMLRPDGFYIRDNGSKNGTNVFRAKRRLIVGITEEVKLMPGDRICLGPTGSPEVTISWNPSLITARVEAPPRPPGYAPTSTYDPARSKEAIDASNNYLTNHEFDGRMPNGFQVVGGKNTINEAGEHGDSRRPSFVVDLTPGKDPALEAFIAEVQKDLAHLKGQPEELLREIGRRAKRAMQPLSESQADALYLQLRADNGGRRLLLGEFITAAKAGTGAGVCQHQSVLTKLAFDSFYPDETQRPKVKLVRGFVGDAPAVDQAQNHAWLEMNHNGQSRIFDPRNSMDAPREAFLDYFSGKQLEQWKETSKNSEPRPLEQVIGREVEHGGKIWCVREIKGEVAVIAAAGERNPTVAEIVELNPNRQLIAGDQFKIRGANGQIEDGWTLVGPRLDRDGKTTKLVMIKADAVQREVPLGELRNGNPDAFQEVKALDFRPPLEAVVQQKLMPGLQVQYRGANWHIADIKPDGVEVERASQRRISQTVFSELNGNQRPNVGDEMFYRRRSGAIEAWRVTGIDSDTGEIIIRSECAYREKISFKRLLVENPHIVFERGSIAAIMADPKSKVVVVCPWMDGRSGHDMHIGYIQGPNGEHIRVMIHKPRAAEWTRARNDLAAQSLAKLMGAPELFPVTHMRDNMMVQEFVGRNGETIESYMYDLSRRDPLLRAEFRQVDRRVTKMLDTASPELKKAIENYLAFNLILGDTDAHGHNVLIERTGGPKGPGIRVVRCDTDYAFSEMQRPVMDQQSNYGDGVNGIYAHYSDKPLSPEVIAKLRLVGDRLNRPDPNEQLAARQAFSTETGLSLEKVNGIAERTRALLNSGRYPLSTPWRASGTGTVQEYKHRPEAVLAELHKQVAAAPLREAYERLIRSRQGGPDLVADILEIPKEIRRDSGLDAALEKGSQGTLHEIREVYMRATTLRRIDANAMAELRPALRKLAATTEGLGLVQRILTVPHDILTAEGIPQRLLAEGDPVEIRPLLKKAENKLLERRALDLPPIPKIDKVLNAEELKVAAEIDRQQQELQNLEGAKQKLSADQVQARVDAYFRGDGHARGSTPPGGTVRNDKVIHIVMGLPGAGKTSAITDPLVARYGARLVDSDKIKPDLPGYRNGMGNQLLHEPSGQVADAVLAASLARGENLVYSTIGRTPESVYLNIEQARAHGYRVAVHFADVSPENSARRVYDRAYTGDISAPRAEPRQLIPPDYPLEAAGHRPRIVFDLIKGTPGLVDAWQHIDTNTTAADGKVVPKMIGQSGLSALENHVVAAPATVKDLRGAPLPNEVRRLRFVSDHVDSTRSISDYSNKTSEEIVSEALRLTTEFHARKKYTLAGRQGLDRHQDKFFARTQQLLTRGVASEHDAKLSQFEKLTKEFASSTERLKDSSLLQNAKIVADPDLANGGRLVYRLNNENVEVYLTWSPVYEAQAKDDVLIKKPNGELFVVKAKDIQVELRISAATLAACSSDTPAGRSAVSEVASSLYHQLHQIDQIQTRHERATAEGLDLISEPQRLQIRSFLQREKTAADVSADHLQYRLNGNSLDGKTMVHATIVPYDIKRPIQDLRGERVVTAMEPDGRMRLYVIDKNSSVKEVDAKSTESVIERSFDELARAVDKKLEAAKLDPVKNRALIDKLEAEKRTIAADKARYANNSDFRRNVNHSIAERLKSTGKVTGPSVTVLFLATTALEVFFHKERYSDADVLDFRRLGP